MAARQDLWTRDQLLVAINFYCRTAFGKLDQDNPEIIRLAKIIGRKPGALAMKLSNLASLDKKITDTGRKGLSGASTLDRQMWAEMNADWDKIALEGKRALDHFIANAPKLDTESVNQEAVEKQNYEGTTRAATVQQRIRQAFFRDAVLSGYKARCCMSQLSEPRLLIASHIVPWSKDKANRLNPRNGLCLSALHDRAFDQGMITVTPDYQIKVSTRMKKKTKDVFLSDSILKLDGVKIRLPDKFLPAQEFLEWHNRVQFVDL